MDWVSICCNGLSFVEETFQMKEMHSSNEGTTGDSPDAFYTVPQNILLQDLNND